MSWQHKRKFLQTAGESTAKAISKSKDLFIEAKSPERIPQSNKLNIDQPPNSRRQLNKWRGEIDSQAFWNLFHKESPKMIDSRYKQYLDELELARVEILGGKTYEGTISNITSSTANRFNEAFASNDEKDPIPPIALNIFLKELYGIKMPTSTITLFRSIKKILNPHKKSFENLIDYLEDQDNYESQAIKILKKIIVLDDDEDQSHSNHDNETQGDDQDIEDENNDSQTTETEDVDSSIDEVDAIDDVEYEASEVDDTSVQEEIDIDREFFEQDFAKSNQPYYAFTDKFDEVINASDLATEQEIRRLREQLDRFIEPHKITIGKLANRLQRLLMAQQKREWSFNLDEGILDTARLSRVITKPGSPLSFKLESENEFKDTVVTLLIDSSGSMRGRSMTLAAICGDIIGSTLDRCNIKTEILGFTTKHWKGGEARKLWISQGSNANPGRLNDLRHIIFKSADDPFRRSRKNFGVMLREGLLKENIDGEALLWSFKRLLPRQEQRKILIVISDGAPVDDSTLSSNHSDYLENHLKAVINKIELSKYVELLAIGIGHDVSKYYDRSITINRAEELGEVLLNELTQLLTDTSLKTA
ncbi:MAG: cobalt chelatase [Pseudomonadota bacterium]|nr:cobalt chelatase [Pseudomonadota bacterium]